MGVVGNKSNDQFWLLLVPTWPYYILGFSRLKSADGDPKKLKMINVWSLAQKWQLAKIILLGGDVGEKSGKKHPQNCRHFWRNLPHRQGQSCRDQVQVAPIPPAAEGRTCPTKCLPGEYGQVLQIYCLDWIGLTGGYWCRHFSEDWSQAQTFHFYCKEFGVKFKDITKILTCWLLMLSCCHLSHLVQGWLCVYMNWYLHWHVSIVGMCLLSTTILISVALVHHPAII